MVKRVSIRMETHRPTRLATRLRSLALAAVQWISAFRTNSASPPRIYCSGVVHAQTQTGRPQSVLDIAVTVRHFQNLTIPKKLDDNGRVYLLFSDDTDTGGPMYPCPNGGFCCGDESCCTSGTPILIANAQAVILRGTQLPPSPAAATITTTTTVTELSPSTSTPSSLIPLAKGQAKNSTKNLAIGLGVGIPLGLALIGVVFFLFRELRRHNNIREKRANDATTSAPTQMGHYPQAATTPGAVYSGADAYDIPGVYEMPPK
jgi:hypothetical protein